MSATRSVRIGTFLCVALVGTVGVIALTTPDGGAAAVCQERKQARAVLRNTGDERIGLIEFWQDSACVPRVVAKVGQFNLDGNESGLSEGFHGFHIHTTGICNSDATNTEGNASPFFTAGSHWNPDERNHGNHRGDLPPLLATTNGLARATVLTDRFTISRLFDDDGSAVIVHQDPDNLAHIPATTSDGEERYHSHAYDVMGPDQDSLATGDGGSRFACGVVKRIERR